MDYAVIFTYSLDDDVAVYLFPTEAAAIRFLRDNYKEEMRVDIEENGFDSVGKLSKDGRYAEIVTHFEDGDDVMEMRIGTVYCSE